MFGSGRHVRRALTALAVFLLGALPSAADAAWLRLRNDTGATIVIQAYTAGNPIPKRTHKLFSREDVSVPVVQPGLKVIVIYNAQFQPVGRATVQFGQSDLSFSIRVKGGNVVLQQTETAGNPRKGPKH